MNRYYSLIIKSLFLILIAFSTSYTYAGLPKLTNPKKWSEQRLTWNDFQIRHIPTDTLRPSYISLDIETEQKRAWIGNTRFEYTDFAAYTYPTSSWYDPDRTSEWDLLSNNILFDLCELNARLLQREFNRSYDSEKRRQAKDHAWNEAEQRLKEFALETDYQNDTAALSHYAQNIQRELHMLPKSELNIPSVDYNWRFGYHIGYWNMNPVGESRNDLSIFHGIDMAASLGFRNIEILMGIKGGGKINLRQPHYFNDKDYVWDTGNAGVSIQYLDLGYIIFSGQYLQLAPFTGIGYCTFVQDDPAYPDDTDKRHELGGLNADAGLIADYIIVHDMHAYANSTRYFIRIRPYLSYARIGGREIWSANISLSFSFDFLFRKGMTL